MQVAAAVPRTFMTTPAQEVTPDLLVLLGALRASRHCSCAPRHARWPLDFICSDIMVVAIVDLPVKMSILFLAAIPNALSVEAFCMALL